MANYEDYAPQAAKWLLADGTITDKLPIAAVGGGDMAKEVYDTDDDGKVDAAETADSVPWSGVSGKPSTFPPSSHNHDGVYAPVVHAHASGVEPIADPSVATAEEIATKLNELIAALQG